MFNIHPFYTQNKVDYNSLGCKPVLPEWPHIGNPIHMASVEAQEKQEKEEVMYNGTKNVNMDINVNAMPAMPAEQSEAQQARARLQGRLYETYYEKTDEATSVFNMFDDPTPNTGKELLDRIAKGMYVHDAAREEAVTNGKRWSGYGPFGFITWRDPARVKDEAGYEAFETKLSEARNNALDEIAALPPEKGLESFRTFQAIPVA